MAIIREKISGKNNQGKVHPVVQTFLNDKRIEERGPVADVDMPDYQILVEKVYVYLKDGLRSNEIYASLCVDDPNMSEDKFKRIVTYAYQFAENEMLKDREIMFQTHMSRYENIYHKAMSMQGFWHGSQLDNKNPKDIQQIMVKYSQALMALKHKEELLGLHDKKVIVEFNDGKATLIEQERKASDGVPGYNLDNLNLEEKIELLSLIKEARTVPIEGIQRVVIKQTKIEIDINNGTRKVIEVTKNIDSVQDITFEEMPPNVVDKFKNTEEKEEVLEVAPTMIDSRPKNMPEAKTAIQVQEMVKKKTLDSLRDKLKKK